MPRFVGTNKMSGICNDRAEQSNEGSGYPSDSNVPVQPTISVSRF